MRRAAALALTAVLLTGCSGGSSTPESTPDVDAIYLDALREEVPRLEDASDDDLLALGDAICELHRTHDDNAEAFVVAVKMATDAGFEAREAGAMNGAAVAALCPEFSG